MADAKRSFVLADKLKAGPFDSRELFLRTLEKNKADVLGLTMTEIDAVIGRDPLRLGDYNRARWTLGGFDLRQCVVWPQMGGRAWAVGDPIIVAKRFKIYEPQKSRVWRMTEFVDVYESVLPIIVIRRSLEVRIDDGSHRAVAIALTGRTYVSAWIGVLNGE